MKDRNWLDITEYAMLFGSGVGSVASAATQQVIYTAAPLSFLMLLNLVNRRRLQQELERSTAISVIELDQKIAVELESLSHRVEVMPEMIDLSGLKTAIVENHLAAISQLAKRISHLQKDLIRQTAPLRDHNPAILRQEINKLQTRSNRFEESIAAVTTNLKHLAFTAVKSENLEASSTQLSREFAGLKTEVAQLQVILETLSDDQKAVSNRTLQDQIDHLNRRLSNLPQPFDASSLRKDIESLLNVVTDLVPRRELARLLTELEKINQQHQGLEQAVTVVRLASTVFRKQLDTLSTKLNAKEEALNWLTGAIAFQPESQPNEELKDSLVKLSKGLATLQQRFNNLPAAPDLTHVHREIQQALAVHVGDLEQQLSTLQQTTQTLEQEQETLRGALNRLPGSVNSSSAQGQLDALTTRVEWAESSLDTIQTQVEETVQRRLDEMSQQIVEVTVLPYVNEMSQQTVESMVLPRLSEVSQQVVESIVLPRLSEISQQVIEETVLNRLSEVSQQMVETTIVPQLNEISQQVMEATVLPYLGEVSQQVMETTILPRLSEISQQMMEEIVLSRLGEVSQQVVETSVLPRLNEMSQQMVESTVLPHLGEVSQQMVESTVLNRMSEMSQQVMEETILTRMNEMGQQMMEETILDRMNEMSQQVVKTTVLPRLSEMSEQIVEEAVKRWMDEASQQFQALAPVTHPSPETLDDLAEGLTTLERQSYQPAMASDSYLRNEIQQMMTAQVEDLQQQLATVAQTLEQEQNLLRDVFKRLPESVSDTVQNQLNSLVARVEWAESNLNAIQSRVPETVQLPLEVDQPSSLAPVALPENTLDEFAKDLSVPEKSLEQPADALQVVTPSHYDDQNDRQQMEATPIVTAPQLTQTPAPQSQEETLSDTSSTHDASDLKDDRPSSANGIDPATSRATLEAALEATQERIIIVFPSPDPETIDDALMQKFEQVLNRKGRIDIGWGHLVDVDKIRYPRCIHQPAIAHAEKEFLQTLLKQLADLKKRYPQHFRFKILGMPENFLVCDRTFAVLGVYPVSTDSPPQPSMGVTHDPEVIQSLIDRFDAPTLDLNNTTAYFNRGTTRYDLGDKQGAILDYNQVIRIDSSDDVAYNNRGLARYDLGDRAGAILDFNQAIQLNSQQAIAYFNRGCARADLGDRRGSIVDFSHAIQYHPDFAIAYFHRGFALSQIDNRKGAISDYNEVIRLRPQDALSYFYRGLNHLKSGDKLKATEDLKNAENLFADQKDKANHQRVRQALTQLEQTLVEANAELPQSQFWPL